MARCGLAPSYVSGLRAGSCAARLQRGGSSSSRGSRPGGSSASRGQLLGCRCEAAPDGSSLPPNQRRTVTPGNSLGPGAKPVKPVLGSFPDGGSGSSSAGNSTSSSQAEQQQQQQQQQQQSLLQQQQPGAAADEPASGSWEEWHQYMRQQDAICQEASSVYEQLEEAVAEENYSRAAALKAQLAEAERADSVGAILQELEEAIKEERYADAAALRDVGGAGLLGWWVGRGTGTGDATDYQGHLLHVTPDFGRYIAQAYTARDIAKLAALADQVHPYASLLQLDQDPGTAGQDREEEGTSPDDYGLPVFELFVRRSAATGQLEQQAAALVSPELWGAEGSSGGDDAQQVVENLAQVLTSELGSSVVSVERRDTPDGGQVVQINIQAPTGDSAEQQQQGMEASSSQQEEDEDSDDDSIRTIDQLAELVQLDADEAEAEAGDAGEASSSSSSDAGASAEAGMFDSDAAGSSLKDAVARLQQEQESFRADLARLKDALTSGGNFSEQDKRDIAEAVTDVQQQMADDAAAKADKARRRSSRDGGAGSGGTADDSGTGSGSIENEEDADELLRSIGLMSHMMLQRVPAQLTWQGRDCFTVTVQDGSSSSDGGGSDVSQEAGAGPSSSSTGGSSDEFGGRSIQVERAAEEETEVPVMVVKPQRKQQAADVASGSSGQQAAAEEEQQRLIEEIEQLQADRLAGKQVPPEQVQEFIQKAVNAALAQSAEARTAAALAAAAPTRYRRLNVDGMVRTDVFNGVYMGAFGPHGPELLHVGRQQMDGEEWVVGSKLTGDQNVPAGEASFRARVGRQHRLPGSSGGRGGYPPEMGVVARYKGQGRVAQSGFSRPTWVEGELLVFCANNPISGGAELGFAFHMDSNNKFLILFSRVHLQDLLAEQED